MADPDPIDVVGAKTLGSLYVSEESPFCALGTEVRAYPVEGTLEHAETQTELDRKPLIIRPWDYQDPVKGLKSGTVKAEYYLQPSAQVLNQALSPAVIAETPLAVILRCLMGGESRTYGTVESANPLAGGCTVTAAEGARIPAGQIVLIEDPAAGTGLVPARILTQAVDAVTWWPALSGVIAAGAQIVNTWTWYPTRTNTRSLSVGIGTAQEANLQWRHRGCTGSFDLKLERDGLARIGVDLASATWAGPDALAYSVAHAADPMAAPIAMRNALVYLQPPATTTRVPYEVDACAIKLNLGNKHLETLGGTEGRRGVMRATGLSNAFAEITLTVRCHRDADITWWTNRTVLSCMLFAQAGAVSSERMVGFDAPTCIVVGKPAVVDATDDELKMTVVLRAKLDTTTTGGTTELAQAPFRLFVG